MRLAKGGLRRNFSSPPAYRPGFSLGQLCQVKRARVNRVPPRQEAFGLWDRRDSTEPWDLVINVGCSCRCKSTWNNDHHRTDRPRIHYVEGPNQPPRVLLGQSRASDELAAIVVFLILALMWPFYIATPLAPDFKILIKWAIKRLGLRTAPDPMSMATRRLDTSEIDCRESELYIPTAENICQGNRRITIPHNIMVSDRRLMDNNVPGLLLNTINPLYIRNSPLREGTPLEERPTLHWRTHLSDGKNIVGSSWIIELQLVPQHIVLEIPRCRQKLATPLAQRCVLID